MHFIFSPFVVPLGAFLVAIVAIISGMINQSQSARLKADQRMAMIARGSSVEDIERLLGKRDEPTTPPKDPLRGLANARRAGIVLCSCGLGLILFGSVLTWIVGEHEVYTVAAAGLIPLAIGIGFFIDYNLQKRELSRFGMEIEPPTH